MENPKQLSGKQLLNKPFMWLAIAAGAVICAYSAYRFPVAQVDMELLLLVSVTVIFGSRIGIEIPHVGSEITVSDTFIFLILLLYGGEAAVLIAAADAFCASMRFSKQWFTRVFNASILACATFATVSVLRLCFGSITEQARGGYSGSFIMTLFLMASVQYLANSGLAALRESLRRDQPFAEI
jgi:hypothetical protein